LSRVSGRKREGEDGYDMNDRKETRLKKVESTVEEKEKERIVEEREEGMSTEHNPTNSNNFDKTVKPCFVGPWPRRRLYKGRLKVGV
jgi:hypothetical protein